MPSTIVLGRQGHPNDYLSGSRREGQEMEDGVYMYSFTQDAKSDKLSPKTF